MIKSSNRISVRGLSTMYLVLLAMLAVSWTANAQDCILGAASTFTAGGACDCVTLEKNTNDTDTKDTILSSCNLLNNISRSETDDTRTLYPVFPSRQVDKPVFRLGLQYLQDFGNDADAIAALPFVILVADPLNVTYDERDALLASIMCAYELASLRNGNTSLIAFCPTCFREGSKFACQKLGGGQVSPVTDSQTCVAAPIDSRTFSTVGNCACAVLKTRSDNTTTQKAIAASCDRLYKLRDIETAPQTLLPLFTDVVDKPLFRVGLQFLQEFAGKPAAIAQLPDVINNINPSTVTPEELSGRVNALKCLYQLVDEAININVAEQCVSCFVKGSNDTCNALEDLALRIENRGCLSAPYDSSAFSSKGSCGCVTLQGRADAKDKDTKEKIATTCELLYSMRDKDVEAKSLAPVFPVTVDRPLFRLALQFIQDFATRPEAIDKMYKTVSVLIISDLPAIKRAKLLDAVKCAYQLVNTSNADSVGMCKECYFDGYKAACVEVVRLQDPVQALAARNCVSDPIDSKTFDGGACGCNTLANITEGADDSTLTVTQETILSACKQLYDLTEPEEFGKRSLAPVFPLTVDRPVFRFGLQYLQDFGDWPDAIRQLPTFLNANWTIETKPDQDALLETIKCMYRMLGTGLFQTVKSSTICVSCHMKTVPGFTSSACKKVNAALSSPDCPDFECPNDGDSPENCKCETGCFPRDATLEVLRKDEPSALVVRMDHLRFGDKVRAIDHGTREVVYRDVYLFGYRDPSQLTAYVSVTAGNTTLWLTPEHFLPVCVSGCDSGRPGKDTKTEYRYAKYIRVGDMVMTATPEPALAVVTDVHTGQKFGVYAPLIRGADIIVNGVAASCWGKWLFTDLVPASMLRLMPKLYDQFLAAFYYFYLVLGPSAWETVVTATRVVEACNGSGWPYATLITVGSLCVVQWGAIFMVAASVKKAVARA